MKKNLFVLLSALLLAVGCSSLPKVYNVEKKTVVLTGGQTMQNAILIGGASKHWVMTAVRPGLITGRLYLRGHQVEVKIPYTDNTYSIEYASSENMYYNAKKSTIHRKYNQWVRNLDLAIYRAATLPARTAVRVETNAQTAVTFEK